MLHGYCIRSLADAPPEEGLRGVGGEEVRVVFADKLSMWVSERDVEPIDVDRLREHEHVVRRALRSATPLPLRFGTVFRDEERVRHCLADGETKYLETLARFEGKVEMSVRVSSRVVSEGQESLEEVYAPTHATPLSPGRAHLEARRRALATDTAARRTIDSLLDEVDTQLADLAVPTVRAIVVADAPFGMLAHLVRREDIRAYRDMIDQTQRRLSDLVIVATGPWAPYSFVG